MIETTMPLQAREGGSGGNREAMIATAVNDALNRLSTHGKFDVEAITMQYRSDHA
jgi:hypothetical protein